MKVNQAVVFLAGIAFCSAVPAPRQVDWTAVTSKFQELNAVIRTTMEMAKQCARYDGMKAGSRVTDFINVLNTEICTAILTRMEFGIATHTLTVAGLRKEMQVLQAWYNAGYTAPADEFSDLIRKVFKISSERVEEIEMELAELLYTV